MSVEGRSLYAWDVDHQGGVTSEQSRAYAHVQDALRTAPAGMCGTVERVRASFAGDGSYVHLGKVARARRDDATGAVVWTDS